MADDEKDPTEGEAVSDQESDTEATETSSDEAKEASSGEDAVASNAHDGGGGESEPTGPEGEGDRVPALFLAEFDTPKDIMHAAERIRDAGFKYWDVHTPFPVHGMDAAMGLGQSHLGWISLGMGMTGTMGAFAMMYWMNGIDYPLIIGGKPPGAVISMIPILFECTVLLCGLGTVFGMLGLNKLPRHHHPVFYSERFERATDDKFFLSIEAQDPKFDLEETRELLESLHPTHIELVEEEIEP